MWKSPANTRPRLSHLTRRRSRGGNNLSLSPPPSFAVGRNCFNRFAFCTYSRSPDELPHYSRPFLTEQEARDERFRRDDEPDSTWRVDWESVGYDAIALVDAF